MAIVKFQHIHLHSPNPEATASFYAEMFIAEVAPDGKTAAPPISMPPWRS